MNFKDQIPPELYEQIVQHIEQNCKTWQKGAFRRAYSDEDTLTGDFWGKLAISEQFDAPNGWSWDIEYNRIRGRGKGAPEKLIGSDGIFQIHIKDGHGKTIFRKSFLFQAKMLKSFTRESVLPQVKQMNDIKSKIGVLIVYGEDKFDTYKSDEFANEVNAKKFDICDYIISEFFKCQHGVENMYFDMNIETLTVPNDTKNDVLFYKGAKYLQVVGLNINQKLR